MQKLTNLLFELLIILEKREVCISQVFNQSIESLHVLISMIRDYYINKHRHESKSANNSLYWNI